MRTVMTQQTSLKVLATVDGRGRAVYAAAVSADAKCAAFGSADGSVRICDLAAGAPAAGPALGGRPHIGGG